MRRSRRALPFGAAVGLFAAYSYGATVVSAAWFLRRAHAVDVATSLSWAALVYAPCVTTGLLVWAVLHRVGAELRGMVALTVMAPPAIAASAWAATVADGTMRSLAWTGGEIVSRTIDRLPVAILLYTAIAAAGLAVAHWRRAIRQRQEMVALSAALAEARRAPAAPETPVERLMVGVGRGRVPVSASDIEWIASAGNYAVMHWGEREGLLRETLQALEARLGPGFARSHRSTLVNLAHVRELRPLSDGAWRLTLDSGAELVVSRTYRDDFLARLGRPIS